MKARALLMSILSFTSAGAMAGQYSFATPAVAGTPGGQTAPLLFIGFRGDGVTTDSQVDFVFDATRFAVQLTPRNGALCQPQASNRIRIISPGSATPLTGALVRYCEVRFTIMVGTAGGSYDFSPSAATIECFGLKGSAPECTAPTGVGVIRVGPNTPQSQFSYLPAVDGSVVLANGSGEISAEFVAGGFGSAIELQDCQITVIASASFGPVLAAPVPLAFDSDLTGTGLLGLSCTRQSVDTTGLLSCTEIRNGTLQATRNWNLLCPGLPPDFIIASGFEDASP